MSQRRRRENLCGSQAFGSQSQRSQNASRLGLSQASSNSQQKSLQKRLDKFTLLDLPSELIQSMVNDCVHCLLISDQKKIPLKKMDIIKAVMKEKPKAFPVVVDEAGKILNKVYGINLVQLEDAKGYVLINQHYLTATKDVPLWPKLETAQHGLLTIVLSIIFMNEHAVEDRVLYAGMKKFGCDIAVPHPIFGNLKKLLSQEFVKQLYLSYTLIDNTPDAQVYEYSWGIRARLETNKRELLSFICKIYGNGMKPEDWTTQFKEIQEEERPVRNLDDDEEEEDESEMSSEMDEDEA